MGKKIIVGVVIAILIVIGAVSLFMNNTGTAVAPALSSAGDQAQTASVQSAATVSNATPLMQSTGAPFSQYQYLSKAHEIFPTLAPDAKKALGAFGYTKEDLGNNTYRFTLTNNAEGYKGQSVVVGAGQSVYFVERSSGDDSDSEDSVTTDDFFVAVDAQGNILK